MNAKTFRQKYNDTVAGMATKTKILNRARKWGLQDTRNENFEYLCDVLTLEQCNEFDPANKNWA